MHHTTSNPLHQSVLPILDPEYIAFHNEHLSTVVPVEHLPWDPKFRDPPPSPALGPSKPLDVGDVKDYTLSSGLKVRAFTPRYDKPEDGWPILIYLHSGGWVFGSYDATEIPLLTRIVNTAKCVVISVNYRLAPENPYPAAVEDAVESLQWVRNEGPTKLSINPNRIAVGGTSGGGNVAAALTLKASSLSIPLVFQLLIAPITDTISPNTANPNSSYIKYQNAPRLTPNYMSYFINSYLPNKADRSNWDASPILAPSELIRNGKVPKSWIAVCEVDVLYDEAIEYAEKLRKEGVQVEVEIYKGAPHSIFQLDAYLQLEESYSKTQA